MTDMDLELLQGLPPEVLEQLMGLGSIEGQQGLAQQQMGIAQQYAQPHGRNYTTGQGAAIGGIADALRSGIGGFMQGQGLAEQKGLVGQQQAGRQQYAKSIADFLRNRKTGPVAL